jgi:Rod binding domain-containing protein
MMDPIHATPPGPTDLLSSPLTAPQIQKPPTTSELADQGELREAFHDFVGQTFFGQLIASMRATQGETPYFHGGRAEKIFQGQLDQQLAETLSEASASRVADPMFHLFQLRQQ